MHSSSNTGPAETLLLPVCTSESLPSFHMNNCPWFQIIYHRFSEIDFLESSLSNELDVDVEAAEVKYILTN